MKRNFFKDKSLNVSLPEPKIIHGIEVKKTPIGQYLTAMRQLEDLPLQIIAELFPGKTLSEILAEFVELTDERLAQLIVRMLTVIPEKAIKAFAVITGTDEASLLALTPKEAYDVGKDWWELNDMSDFFAAAAGLIKKLLPQTLKSGSSAGSPLPPPSSI